MNRRRLLPRLGIGVPLAAVVAAPAALVRLATPLPARLPLLREGDTITAAYLEKMVRTINHLQEGLK